MAVEWYALSAFTELGPMGRDALTELIRAGEIDGDTPVREGNQPWRPLREVPGLCDIKVRTREESAKVKVFRPRKKGAISDAIDAAMDAEEAADENDGIKVPHTATPTEMNRTVTKEELRKEARDMFSEMAPSLPYWMMGAGSVIALCTMRGANWSPAVVAHYGGIVAALTGAVVWVRTRLGRAALWVTPVTMVGAFLALVFWVSIDLQVLTYTSADGATHRDTSRRWSGEVLSRVRTLRQPRSEYQTWGPTNPAGVPHGFWQIHWYEPAENNTRDAAGSWFYNGQLVTQEEWESRQRGK